MPTVARLSLLLLALAARAQASGPSDSANGALVAGHRAYLGGQIEKAGDDYRRALALQNDQVPAIVSLALAYKDLGKLHAALPLWIKACRLAPGDSFVWLQRGWALLGLQKFKAARQAFAAAADLNAPGNPNFEAELGLGMTEIEAGRPREAVQHLQRVALGDPYWLAAAYHLLGEAALAQKKLSEAVQFEQEALQADSYLSEAAWSLARLYDELGQPLEACQAYQALLSRDPANERLRKEVGRLSPKTSKLLQALSAVRRIARPLAAPAPRPSSEELQVALLADAQGRASVLRKINWLATSDFEVLDSSRRKVASGKALEAWEALYRQDRGLYELKGAQGRLIDAQPPLRIQPAAPGATILLKDMELAKPEPGIDSGDRELRGSIELEPAEGGFLLVNEVGVEDYLPSVVAEALPAAPLPLSLQEAAKAVAVLYRSRALQLARRPRHSGGPYRLCDSAHCLIYRGVQGENGVSRRAAEATRGERLGLEGSGDFTLHSACAGQTETGVSDGAAETWAIGSPRELEERVRSLPSDDLNCRMSSLVPPASLRWVRVIDVNEISTAGLGLGDILAFTPGKRSALGRLQNGLFRGSAKSLGLDAEGIESALSPSALRSTLFTITPLYRGKRLQWLILWGAGTGDGRGLCRGGALGLAAQGRSYREILGHYYPRARFIPAP